MNKKTTQIKSTTQVPKGSNLSYKDLLNNARSVLKNQTKREHEAMQIALFGYSVPTNKRSSK